MRAVSHSHHPEVDMAAGQTGFHPHGKDLVLLAEIAPLLKLSPATISRQPAGVSWHSVGSEIVGRVI
jgi:hypothetical protein